MTLSVVFELLIGLGEALLVLPLALLIVHGRGRPLDGSLEGNAGKLVEEAFFVSLPDIGHPLTTCARHRVQRSKTLGFNTTLTMVAMVAGGGDQQVAGVAAEAAVGVPRR